MHWTAKKVLSWLSGILLIGTIVFYAYYQSRAILEGPQISLITPTDGTTTATALIPVVGTVRHSKEILLDGRPIFVDLQGNFSEQLLLMVGYNIIELKAKDAQGREQRKTITLVYKPESSSP